MKKQELKNYVANCFPSIFTKEDVLKLIDMISENEIPKNGIFIPEDNKDKFIDWITDDLCNYSSEVIDFDGIRFNVDYSNRIEIENLEFSSYSLNNCIENAIVSYLENEESKKEETEF